MRSTSRPPAPRNTVLLTAILVALVLGLSPAERPATAAPGSPGEVSTSGSLAALLGLLPGADDTVLPARVPFIGQVGARSQEPASGPASGSADALAPTDRLAPDPPSPVSVPRQEPPDRRTLHLPLALRVARPAPAPTPLPPDPTKALFVPDSLLDVEIEMDPADWAALRVEARTMAGILGETECLSEPHVHPYTFFPADVRVNGIAVANVGVRKKGFLGSVSSTKPALKVKFDEFVDGQRHSGMRRLTLNNAKQDPSHLRQCIAYDLFTRAGVPAPRCSFARVTVNGQYLGVYAHVESMKKPLVARHFADDGGNLYEGMLSDFTPAWVKTFERKTNKADDDRSDLDAVVAALEADDEALLEALESVLDVDAFLGFWAAEVLTGHWDGYAGNRNNYLVYGDPGSGRFHFLPWGADAALRPSGAGQRPMSVMATARLPRRLYLHPEGQDLYLTRLRGLLDRVWDEARLLAEIDRMSALVRPALPSGQRASFDAEVARVRHVVRTHRAAIESELRAGPPDWDVPESGPPCRRVVGHLDATFAANWGQGDSTTVTAEVRFGDSVLPMAPVFVAAGRSGSDPWPAHPVVQVAGVVTANVSPWRRGDVFLAILYVDPDRFGPRRTVDVDGNDAFSWVLRGVPNGRGGYNTQLFGLLWGGELTLGEAGVTAGSAVTGTIDADVVTWGGL